MSTGSDGNAPVPELAEESGPEAGVRRYRARRDRGIDKLLRELHPDDATDLPEDEQT